MHKVLTVIAVSLVMAKAGHHVRAEDVEQALVEATILRDGKVVSQPNLLVRLGKQAEISISPKGDGGPRLGLKFRAEALEGEERKAVVTGVVDGKETPAATLWYSMDGETTTTFDGGGYSWTVRAARVTPQLLERRKNELAKKRRQ